MIHNLALIPARGNSKRLPGKNMKLFFGKPLIQWTIDLAKGKPSVEVESGEALVKALETIKIAVEAGELDAQIEIASAKLRSGFGK